MIVLIGSWFNFNIAHLTLSTRWFILVNFAVKDFGSNAHIILQEKLLRTSLTSSICIVFYTVLNSCVSRFTFIILKLIIILTNFTIINIDVLFAVGYAHRVRYANFLILSSYITFHTSWTVVIIFIVIKTIFNSVDSFYASIIT